MNDVREHAALQLCRIWQQGRRPDLAEVLASAGPLSPLDLAAVLRVDQRQRWLIGQRIPAEQYLQAYPAVATDQEAALDLVSAELRLREELGEAVAHEAFFQRFPSLADELRQQHEFGKAVQPIPPACPPGPPVRESAETTDSAAPVPTATEPMPPPTAPPPPTPPGRRVRCPHCHNPIQLGDNQPDEVLCPVCGSGFRVPDTRSTESLTRSRLGKFELLERVGLGAFGAVWRAWDTDLHKFVALKVPHAGLSITPEESARVYDEARKLALLRHPGIVAVHEVALLQGLPVIVSDFIQGVPLSDLLQVRKLTFREAAVLIAEVATALDYAHRQGVVHRDVKPANVMVEYGPPAGGGPVADDLGKPLLLDFGLALREQAVVTMTMDGQIIGTPAYMSPEQAAGKGHRADCRSDVFSLGVVLYELLCGELPFRGSRLMMLMQVQFEDPKAPRSINDKVPLDLEKVCLMCLRKDPDKRYNSAAALAEDLRSFLRGGPVKARPEGRPERLWRWCRRHPGAAGLLSTVFVLLALLAAGASVAAVQIEHARQRAELKHQQAENRFGETLEMVDLLTRVAVEVLENTPQMEDSQLRLLKKAQDQLAKLLADRPDDRGARHKLALVDQRMGNIWWKHGKYDLAQESYESAIEAFDQLAREDPQNGAAYRHHWAVCQNDLAEVLRETKSPEARRHFDLALTVQTSPTDLNYPLELARTQTNLALLSFDTAKAEQMREPDELFTSSIKHLKNMKANRAQSEAERQSELARAYVNRGNLYECRKEFAKAEEDYQEAIRLLEGLKTAAPNKHDYQYKLGAAYVCLGYLRETSGQPGAGEAHEKALPLFIRLVNNFPRYHLYRKLLALTYDNIGAALADEGPKVAEKAASVVSATSAVSDPFAVAVATQLASMVDEWPIPASEKAFLNARDHYKELLKGPGVLPEYRSLAASNLTNLAYVARNGKEYPKALQLAEEAIRLQEKALQSDLESREFLQRLNWHHRVRASILVKQGKLPEAARGLAKRAAATGAPWRDELARRAVAILAKIPRDELRELLTRPEEKGAWALLRSRKDFQQLLPELGNRPRK